MERTTLFLACGLLMMLNSASAELPLHPVLSSAPRTAAVPPPAAPPQTHDVDLLHLGLPLTAATAPTPYSIGEPTDEEQLYLEYLNRARRDPAAEAARLRSTTDPVLRGAYDFFHVDLALMEQQIASLPSAPPLSFNAALIAAARRHSQDMLANDFQEHEGLDGSTFGSRATDAGYTWTRIAENIFNAARSVEHGHAGFEVDWADLSDDKAVGGMQNPPGHRLNIHSANFHEIGIGVILGTNGEAGPQVVTQDFGTRQGLTPFITGVVFYDLNTNTFYDLGEGLGGVNVRVTGSTSFAVTANSGGYSVPVPGAGDYSVTFDVPGLEVEPVSASVASDNVKLDYVLSYIPPTVAGPETVALGQSTTFTFTAMGGATGYEWRRVRRSVPAVEGAEEGLARVIASTTPSYPVVESAVKASGNNSFHLAHPRAGDTDSGPATQTIELNRVFRAGANPQLSFASRLGWAAPDQIARAQISTDGGATWTDVWSQAGTDDAGESNFSTQTVPLTGIENQEFRVRFIYELVGQGFFLETDPGVGFHIDDIALTGADELSGETISEVVSGLSFNFAPTEPGEYALSVRPKIGQRRLPWGPARLVSAQAGSGLIVRFGVIERLANGRLGLGITVVNPGAANLEVQSAPDATGPWSTDPDATILPGGTAETFRAEVPAMAGPRRFFRIVAN